MGKYQKVVINNNSARTISLQEFVERKHIQWLRSGDDTYMIHYSGCSIVHSDIGYTEYSDVPYIVYDPILFMPTSITSARIPVRLLRYICS